MLGLDDLKQFAESRRIEKHELDSKPFWVRELNTGEMQECKERFDKAGFDPENVSAFMVFMSLWSVCNEQGQRAFTDDDFTTFNTLPASKARVITKAVSAVHSLSVSDGEDSEKN